MEPSGKNSESIALVADPPSYLPQNSAASIHMKDSVPLTIPKDQDLSIIDKNPGMSIITNIVVQMPNAQEISLAKDQLSPVISNLLLDSSKTDISLSLDKQNPLALMDIDNEDTIKESGSGLILIFSSLSCFSDY